MSEESALVVVMNSVAAALAQPGDISQTLAAITQSARLNIPDVDYVSISFWRDGHDPETMASTDPLTKRLDALQYALREGPAYDVVTIDNVTYASDLERDSRWPEFGPRAASVGVRSQMSIGLHADAKTRTGLNIYSHRVAAFDQPDDMIALFASHARIALGFAHEVDTLTVALSTRKLIGQAVGILRERYDLDEQRAFEFLVRVSQTSNVKLRAVAEEIVAMPAGKATQGVSATASDPVTGSAVKRTRQAAATQAEQSSLR